MSHSRVRQVEDYVRKTIKEIPAHGFNHVDRVRNRALEIAREEGYEDLDQVEVASLLHDIGFSYVDERRSHGQKGAEFAEQFLKENVFFSKEKTDEIINAIKWHSSKNENSGNEKLLEIIRDADMLDAMGAVGIMRAFTSKYNKPEYNPANIRGSNWSLTGKEYDALFASGREEGDNIIDQLNLQISYFDNLNTEAAKRYAQPLIDYMKQFILQLESEVCLRSGIPDGEQSDIPG